MSPEDLMLSAIAAFTIGALIGGVGVGGVLLAPWLTQVIGLPLRDALGITMLAFVLPGAVALLMAGRAHRRLTARDGWMLLATIPGAWLGTALLGWLPASAVYAILAGAVMLVGGRLVLSARPVPVSGRSIPVPQPGPGVGLVTGFASAISATGGPMVLTPWMVWRGLPLLEAILLGQYVQLPIAVTASVANWRAGGIDIVAGLSIGLMLVPGMLTGQRIAPVLPGIVLGRVVGVILIGAGVVFLKKAL